LNVTETSHAYNLLKIGGSCNIQTSIPWAELVTTLQNQKALSRVHTSAKANNHLKLLSYIFIDTH